MKNRSSITLAVVVLVSLLAVAFVPSLTDFNVLHFDTTGNKVSIRTSAFTTNSFFGVTNALGYFPATNGVTLGFQAATNSNAGITNALGYIPATNNYGGITNSLGFAPATNGVGTALGYQPATNSLAGITNALGYIPMTNSAAAVTNALGYIPATNGAAVSLGYQPATNTLAGITNALGYIPMTNSSAAVTNALGYIPATNGVVPLAALTNNDTRIITLNSNLIVQGSITVNGGSGTTTVSNLVVGNGAMIYGDSNHTNGTWIGASGEVLSNAIGSATIRSGSISMTGNQLVSGNVTNLGGNIVWSNNSAGLNWFSTGSNWTAYAISTNASGVMLTNRFVFGDKIGGAALDIVATNGISLFTLSQQGDATASHNLISAAAIKFGISGALYQDGGGLHIRETANTAADFSDNNGLNAISLKVSNINVITINATNGLVLPTSTSYIKWSGVGVSNPPTAGAGTAFLFAATNSAQTAEIFSMDGAGTVKQISEHAIPDAPPSMIDTNDPFPNVSMERNDYLGQVRWINRSREALVAQGVIQLAANSYEAWLGIQAGANVALLGNDNVWATNRHVWAQSPQGTNWYLTMKAFVKAKAADQEVTRLESYAAYNARLGLYPGDPRYLALRSWGADQLAIWNGYILSFTNALNAYNAAAAAGDTNAVAPVWTPPTTNAMPSWMSIRGAN